MSSKNNVSTLFLGLSIAIASFSPAYSADPEIDAAARSYLEEQALSWLDNPIVVNAIKAQNTAHASFSQNNIDALDQQWRSESAAGSGPLVDKVLSNELSAFLQNVREESQGLITEVFVMDNLGLNVGQSDMTSDFWQGDEAKWQKTFNAGPNTLFVDEVELDESSQRYQTQVSYSITDPANGNVIGAVTIGIDAEGLLML